MGLFTMTQKSRLNQESNSDLSLTAPSRFYTGPIEIMISQSGEKLTVLVPSEIPELHVFTTISIGDDAIHLEAPDGRRRPCYALSDAIGAMNEIRVAVLVAVGLRGPDMTRILTIRREQNVAGKPSGIRAGHMA